MNATLKAVTKAEIAGLLERHESRCVSLLLAEGATGPDVPPTRDRYRALLQAVEEYLIARGETHQAAREFVAPARAFLHDPTNWDQPSAGLAIYLGPRLFQVERLPYACDEGLTIASYFRITPLLPLLDGDHHFYILALSQNEVRLLRGTPYTIAVVPLPEGVPASLADALRYDDLEPRPTVYAGTPGAAGRQGSMFYGRGDGREDHEQQLRRYCQQIDRGLHALLHDERAPLVLAGVEYLLPIYRQANTYAHLATEGIAGNPESKNVAPATLREQAWAIVAPLFGRRLDAAQDRYRELAGTGLTADRPDEVLPAAQNGRVDTLFLATDRQHWGTFDPATGRVMGAALPGPDNDDLGNIAALETLRCGGTVYPVEAPAIPGGAGFAAILRY